MIHRLAVTAFAAAFFAACADTQTETPPAEPTPAEGVFGLAAPAVGGIPTVLTLAPLAVTQSEADDTGEVATMDQFGLTFSPREMFAPVGRAVPFTNSEADLTHNVHIRAADSGAELFNDDANSGQTLEFVFPEEGGYDVSCDMHPGMTAFVFATNAPYFVFADGDGNFNFYGVPEGEYTLRVWSIDTERRSEQNVVIGDGATELRVATSR